MEMVDQFEKLMKKYAVELQIVATSIKTSSRYDRTNVALEFKNGVQMDLLPASSLEVDPEKQRTEVFSRMKKDPSRFLLFSSSLAETALQFMKDQSGAAHQLIRLAKYWYKMCTLGDRLYGGSTIMEILCIDVAYELDPLGRGTEFQMLAAFRAFLKRVSVINTLKIAFYRNGKNWVKVAPNEFKLPKYQNYFHAPFLTEKNFIIEPANPYNNLAKNIKPIPLKRLKQFSAAMLKRLDDLESPVNNDIKKLSADGKTIEMVYFNKLFEPFILSLKNYYPASAIPTSVCIDYFYQNYFTAQANVEVRQDDFFKKNAEAKKLYRAVLNSLLFLIRGRAMRTAKNGLSFTNGITDVTKADEVKSAVKTFLDANNFGKNVTESNTNDDHKDYHVTLSIPYRRMDKIYAVRFSMKWKI